MKKFRKILSVLLLFFIIFNLFSLSFATELKTELNVIQQASETKYLENDQGYISKTIVDSDSEKGEVTVELKVANTKKDITKDIQTEIFLVVDNSPSMDFVTLSGDTRKEIVLNSASKLVSSIFDTSSNVKMGLVDFHGAYGWSNPPSISNATLRQNLTNNKEKMLSAIQAQLERDTYSGTNIDAGLRRAKQYFSSTADNKVIILLTDGIPNADTKNNSTENDTSTAESKVIQANTKQAILDLKAEGIYIISMLTGMDVTDGHTDKNGTEYDASVEDELIAAEFIFGTPDNPTADKYYLAKSADLDNIISNDILRDVSSKISQPINTVKIVDHFPENITDNFDFSYVGDASIGTKTDEIDEDKKTITWNMETLKGDEVATLKYKLKIKDMKNAELLEKTIATNEKVVLTYTDVNAKEYTVTLSSSPKIRLSRAIEPLTATVSYDPTTKTTKTVKATIKTNKPVNSVNGWTLSEDKMSLTKDYSQNVTELVHLTDYDDISTVVTIHITNIEELIPTPTPTPTSTKDETTYEKPKLPQTGEEFAIVLGTIAVISIGAIIFIKYKKFDF